MNKKAIVITTINYPSEAVIKFSRLKNFQLFIAGDNKTPRDWNLENTKFLSIDYQHRKYKKLSNLIAQNHYARKNLAYLDAIKLGTEFLYETDDDNIPYNFFPNFFEKKTKINEIDASLVFNIYSLFTKKNVWPRGLPLSCIRNKEYHVKKATVEPLIQQSLSNLDPDVDAIYRLTINDKIKFDVNKFFSLKSHVYCPFNSQSTFWHNKVFPLLYLPSTVESRVTDIWRGYIAQKILWELDSELIFLSPSVYQKRNIHNFMKDFREELDLYIRSEDFVRTLESINLSGSIENMLLKTYKRLATANFFDKKEIDILKGWLNELEN